MERLNKFYLDRIHTLPSVRFPKRHGRLYLPWSIWGVVDLGRDWGNRFYALYRRNSTVQNPRMEALQCHLCPLPI